MTPKNFAYKMWYAYFQAYDVTFICLVLVRILYSNSMLYNKKTYWKHNKKLQKNNVIFALKYHK